MTPGHPGFSRTSISTTWAQPPVLPVPQPACGSPLTWHANMCFVCLVHCPICVTLDASGWSLRSPRPPSMASEGEIQPPTSPIPTCISRLHPRHPQGCLAPVGVQLQPASGLGRPSSRGPRVPPGVRPRLQSTQRVLSAAGIWSFPKLQVSLVVFMRSGPRPHSSLECSVPGPGKQS